MKKITIPFGDTTLIGDITGADPYPSVLFLHGAGMGNRGRFTGIRNLLEQNNISSVAFDFIGQGETGGDLKKSSLKQRTEQAQTVIKTLDLKPPLSIFAASMSGYTAVKLTECVAVKNLIFFAPAVYATEAYDTPFGDGFSDLIRQPESWQHTDAWNILENFTGNLLIFAAGRDEVVPDEVIQKILRSASKAQWKKIVTIAEATHPLGKYLEEHSQDLQMAFKQILPLL